MWIALTLVVLAMLTGGALALKRKKLLVIPAVLVLAVTVGTAICFTAPVTQAVEPDYAVLLGAGLEDGQVTDELVRRMELALQWLEETPETILIVTGGDPDHQGITEGAAMYDWLEAHGADVTRIWVEDQAQDTRQNLLYCKNMAHERELETDTILILTSEYHQTRARFLAHQNGQTAAGLSCRTPFWERLNASVREVYSFVKAVWETV